MISHTVIRRDEMTAITRCSSAVAVLVLVLTVAPACGGGDDNGGGGGGNQQPSATALDPSDFQVTVDNPLFPLVPGASLAYEGEEDGAEIRVESTVLEETDTIAGIEVTIVEVKDFEDGELVESTRDHYAQHKDGTVYYMGERVDDYEGGQVVGHGGQWRAGEGDNQAGVFMPADPKVGDEFEQERAPGIAEDRSKVVAVDQTVDTPAGSFSGCIKTEDLDPLSGHKEIKFYCPDVGLVREESSRTFLDLVSR
jgi:hypothetical protein